MDPTFWLAVSIACIASGSVPGYRGPAFGEEVVGSCRKQAQATHHHGVVEAIASRGGSRGPSMLTTNVFGIGSVRETLKQVGQERQAACPNTTPRAGPLHKAPYAQCTVLVWPDGVSPVGQLGVWKWPVRQCASAELHSWFFVLSAGSRTVSRHMHALYCSCTVTGWKSWTWRSLAFLQHLDSSTVT